MRGAAAAVAVPIGTPEAPAELERWCRAADVERLAVVPWLSCVTQPQHLLCRGGAS